MEYELEKIGFNNQIDRLFTVGDLTDRGPESYRAAEFIEFDWFHTIQGNHESLLLNALGQENKDYFTYLLIQNGGQWISSCSEEFLQEYKSKIENLPFIIQVGNIGIIHASVPFNQGCSWKDIINYAETCSYDFVWTRENIFKGVSGIDHVYHGHTIVEYPKTISNITNLDTGAFKKYKTKGHLTIKNLEG